MFEQITEKLNAAANTLVKIAVDLADVIPTLVNVLGWSSVIVGLCISIGASVGIYYATDPSRQTIGPKLSPYALAGLFLLGGAMISFPSTLGMISTTTFGDLVPFNFDNVKFTVLGQEMDENGQKTLRALFQWVWFLGFVFIFSGLLKIRQRLKGQQDASGLKILIQIIGGSACMNAITLLSNLNLDAGIGVKIT